MDAQKIWFRPNFFVVEECQGFFRLQAWNKVFFVRFIDFVALLSARLGFKRGKMIKKQKMLHSTLVLETLF